jgi:hypothetical protein
MVDEDVRKSRVVVQTPTSRREVTQTESMMAPERSGISSTTVGVIVVLAVAVITVLVLLLLNGQTNNTNSDLAAQQAPAVPQNTIVQQPAPATQPAPVIIQQPAPVTQPPVIVNPAAPAGGSTTNVPDDASIQAEIDKRISDDPTYSALGITATVLNEKVTLVGAVKTEAMKLQIERMVKTVKGVKSVDNQIAVNTGE